MRVTFSDANNDGTVDVTDIKQVNSYYPFGLNMEGSWNGAAGANKYQYNGKEWNDDFGLGWNDYGARFYDPAVARWNGIDILAEKYSSWNPYSYVKNNPLKYVDPDGKVVVLFDKYGRDAVRIGKDGKATIKYKSTGDVLLKIDSLRNI